MELFKIFGTIALSGQDQFNSGLDKATKAGEKLSKAVGKGLATAAKVGAAAVTAASAAVGVLLKNSIESYAEYEQLVGGVDTLFGESSKKVQQYAAKAYTTAGMSANDYMATVTSFSASLLQSLGGNTELAADIADMAITDMSDNANKMGTDIAAIQNAYQGFAKQNYTMLDNLKLGYGGTKTEMERLLADAEKLTGIKYDINNLSDVYNAIHVIQTEMGITGTTADEAAKTISGSVASMKASWSNLLTGMANDNADFELLVNQFVGSVETAIKNLMPRIQIALSGVASLISGLAPVLISALPGLISEVVPGLLDAAISIINALTAALPGIIAAIVPAILAQAPAIVAAGFAMMSALSSGLFQALAQFAPDIIQVVKEIGTMWLKRKADMIKAGIALIQALAEGIRQNVDKIIPAIQSIAVGIAGFFQNNVSPLLDAALSIVLNLVDGITSNIPLFVSAALAIVTAIGNFIVNNLGNIIQAASGIITAVGNGIITALPQLIPFGVSMLVTLAEGIATALPVLLPTIVDVVAGIAEMLTNSETLSTLIQGATTIITTLAGGLIDALPGIIEKAPEIIGALVDGILENLPTIFEAGCTLLGEIIDGIAETIPALWTAAGDIVSNLITSLIDFVPDLLAAGGTLASTLWEGFTGLLTTWFPGLSKIFGDATNGTMKEAEANMETWTPTAETAATNAVNAAAQVVLTSGELIPVDAETPVSAMADIMAQDMSMEEAGSEAVNNAASRMNSAVSTAGFDGAGKTAMTKFATGINSMSSVVMNAVNSIANAAVYRMQQALNDIQAMASNATVSAPGHALGLNYVPYDNYLAYLHKGEAVLTAEEATAWRAGKASSDVTVENSQANGGNNSGWTINQYIETVPQTPVEFAAATEAYFEQARWAMA